MKTKELSRGNLVYFEGVESVIDGIQPSWVWLTDNASTLIDEIEPILLTKERLLKFGFEDNGLSFSNCDIYERGDFRILVNRSHKDFAFTHKNISPPSLSMRTIKYVHELQNIVFALTGEELAAE